MSLRDARATAVTRRHRELADDFTRTLPLLLDDLDVIDREQVPGGIVKVSGTLTHQEAQKFAEQWTGNFRAPTDAELAAWVERNPKAFADWAARQARTAAPKPATRRRTTR